MEAKELRIRNYLQDRGGRLCKVESINYDKQEGYSFYAPAIVSGITSLPNKPIPLTEEWLVKFGAEKEPMTCSFNISRFNSEYKRLIINVSNKMIAIRNGDLSNSRGKDELIVIFNGDVDGDLFVHTLQNLYFALTGEELTIK